jgi:hypothetical protein
MGIRCTTTSAGISPRGADEFVVVLHARLKQIYFLPPDRGPGKRALASVLPNGQRESPRQVFRGVSLNKTTNVPQTPLFLSADRRGGMKRAVNRR